MRWVSCGWFSCVLGICPWRCVYLSAELGEQWVSCGWLRCALRIQNLRNILGGVCIFLRNLQTVSFMWMTQVKSEMSVPFYRSWWTARLRCVLGGFCTFLQNLVNSEFPVADSGMSLEVSVPFCRTWWTVNFLWLTQVCPWSFLYLSTGLGEQPVSCGWLRCPWRYLYLSAELGEQWISCGWLRCVLGGFLYLSTELDEQCVSRGWLRHALGGFLYLSTELGEQCVSRGWLGCVLGGFCTFLQNLVNSELHVAGLEISGFMVTVQHVSRVGFLVQAYRKLASWLVCLSDFTVAVT